MSTLHRNIYDGTNTNEQILTKTSKMIRECKQSHHFHTAYIALPNDILERAGSHGGGYSDERPASWNLEILSGCI